MNPSISKTTKIAPIHYELLDFMIKSNLSLIKPIMEIVDLPRKYVESASESKMKEMSTTIYNYEINKVRCQLSTAEMAGLMFSTRYNLLGSTFMSIVAVYVIVPETPAMLTPQYVFLCHVIIYQHELPFGSNDSYMRIERALEHFNLSLDSIKFIVTPYPRVMEERISQNKFPPIPIISCLIQESWMYTSGPSSEEICCQLSAKDHIDAGEGSKLFLPFRCLNHSLLHGLGKIVSKKEDTPLLLSKDEENSLSAFKSVRGSISESYPNLKWIPTTTLAARRRFEICLPLLLANGMSEQTNLHAIPVNEFEQTLQWFDILATLKLSYNYEQVAYTQNMRIPDDSKYSLSLASDFDFEARK
jgi:hypothetical protein